MKAPGRLSFHVAVVGAGVAGLACARSLQEHGIAVTVFDKGRSPGGRVATRRAPPHTFDLGAQYFTVRDERFRREVRSWIESGACAPWPGRIVALDDAYPPLRTVDAIERFVGTPAMSSLARHVAVDLPVRSSHRVESVARHGKTIALRGTKAAMGVTLGPASSHAKGAEDLGTFDCVVLCLPPTQAALLLDDFHSGLASEVRRVPFDPCIAVGFAASGSDVRALEDLAFDGAFIGRNGAPSRSPLSWIARDSSKPGRSAGERWVLHASPAWSRASWQNADAEVTAALVDDLAQLFGLSSFTPACVVVQRWLHARASHPLDCGALFDEDARVGVGGDWTCGGRVEGAFLAGLALSERILSLHV